MRDVASPNFDDEEVFKLERDLNVYGLQAYALTGSLVSDDLVYPLQSDVQQWTQISQLGLAAVLTGLALSAWIYHFLQSGK